MPREILQRWKDYESLKREGEDVNIFIPKRKWEADYLKNKIKKRYPTLPAKEIFDAIDQCAKTMTPPYKREEFVMCVVARLNVRG